MRYTEGKAFMRCGKRAKNCYGVRWKEGVVPFSKGKVSR